MDDIISFRASDGSSVKLECRSTLHSTLELAREYAKAGYPDKYVVFTERQATSSLTAAKHTSGEYENGIFMSCILRPTFFSSQAGPLGPLSAVALCTALEQHTTKKPGIGWVSDIYCGGRRIGGTAIEGKLNDYTSYEYLIVSFAVRTDGDNFPGRLSDMVKKVFESDDLTVGTIIAKSILNKFFTVYSAYKSPEKYMDIYKDRFMLYGKKIKYIEDGRKRGCRVLDVDKSSCSLLVETSSGIKEIRSPRAVIIPDRFKPEKSE